MEEENKHIDELIANYLTEGLDKNALDELKTWIAASAENQQYFIRQREIWFSAVSREAASVYDKDKAFENFRNRVESQKEIQSTSRRGFSLSALWRYAAVVAIIIAVGCISYWQGEVNVKDTFADISVEAPLGSKTKLYLPDDTLVWLNAGSRMTYSQGFGVDNRKVELEGEGYFEVKRNEKIPFFVKTKDLQLQVLGTKFNFRDYPEDHEVVVSLLEGKVGLNNLLREEKEAVLSPDERAVLNKANGLLTVESVTASNASQWTDGYLFFDEELLPDIAKELERSYNVKIHIANDSLKTFRFYGNFVRREQNIQEVLEALASTEKMQYKIEERNITIY
jgi:ferric-dicitrate binding protein FerR (iron transport regulator)